MKAKKLKIIPVLLIVTIISAALALAVWGLSAGLNEPELDIIATNLSFRDSVYIKYAVSFKDISSMDDIELLIWRDPQEDYTLGTEDASIKQSGTSIVSGNECLIFDYSISCNLCVLPRWRICSCCYDFFNHFTSNFFFLKLSYASSFKENFAEFHLKHPFSNKLF